ncbi:hypothetical protein N7540_011075 [Penicillium herquei]|nr:hypothetical protein N7540_011075 [Penicillium herquei]
MIALFYIDDLHPILSPRHRVKTQRVTKRADRLDATHRTCFKTIRDIGRELDETVAQMGDKHARTMQELEQSRSQEAVTASELRDITVATEKAQAETARLTKQVGELQQQLATVYGMMQGQIPWHNIQSFLQQARYEMESMTTRFGNWLAAFQSQATGFHFPASGAIHGNTVDPGHIALPELPSTGDLPFPSSVPQQPATAFQYGAVAQSAFSDQDVPLGS